MPHFLCRLTPPRSTFMADMSEEERSLMNAHVVYWRPFVEVGTVIAMGSVADPAGVWGLAILEAASPEALGALLARDPAILADRGFRYATYPMPAIAIRPGDAKAPVSSISP
jgi:YCII-related domain